VNLDHSNAQPEQLLYVSQDVGGVPGMQAAAGKQPLGVCFDVVDDELIHARGEADDLGRDVVDEHRPLHSRMVEVLKESFRGSAELDDLIKVRPVLLHEFQRVRLEHLNRLDVDVAVGDQECDPTIWGATCYD
jgi:hypothetical protein